jgi:hypothetical protein
MQSAGFRNLIFYRMDSLISFLLYAWFLYKGITYKAPFWRPRSDWWLALFFLPPVMLYFASGRGYGMAIAFFIGALYYMQVWLQEKKQSAYWKFFLLGALSSLSIISFLFVFLAMLIYILFRSGEKLFSKINIITAIILLPLLLYIYYVGKTILLHDKIINGTDNLILNGMYSTFAATLGLYDFIVPVHDLPAKIDIFMISKILVIVSFLPVAWIMIRRRRAKYPDLTILLIMTLLFLLSHLLLKAKYPSDRSALYIFYLLYIPVVLYIVQYRDKFFKLHYFILLFFSLINGFSFFYVLSRPDIYQVLQEQPAQPYTIVSDWPNWGDDVSNELYFGGRLHFQYIAKSFEDRWDLADERLKTALQQPGEDFFLLQRSTWLRDRQLFGSGYQARPVISSSGKELYFIQKKRPVQ